MHDQVSGPGMRWRRVAAWLSPIEMRADRRVRSASNIDARPRSAAGIASRPPLHERLDTFVYPRPHPLPLPTDAAGREFTCVRIW